MYGKKRIERYRKILTIFMLLGILAIPLKWYCDIYAKVPARILLREGKNELLDLNVPVSGNLYKSAEEMQGHSVTTAALDGKKLRVSLKKPITFIEPKSSSYQMDLKLLGIIPLKHVDVQVIKDKRVIPAGIPIGIYVKTEGVLVIDTGKFKDMDGNWQQPAEFALNSGDYIESINGEKITNKEDFVEKVANCSGKELIIRLLRQNENIDVKVRPHKNESGEYKLGIWVRDSAQGIGTLTYIDQNKKYGALGHGINDIDTSDLMAVESGTLYTTQVLDITPGKNGTPGEITGVIQYEEQNILGNIEKNTPWGIFGEVNESLYHNVYKEPIPVGLKQDIEIGPAQIVCTLGRKTEAYDIEITKLNYFEENSNRGILIEVVDQELLERTGGIVQGMSGAPIIQNGKLIGAVTHVLVQDPTKGYGIFVETMLEQE